MSPTKAAGIAARKAAVSMGPQTAVGMSADTLPTGDPPRTLPAPSPDGAGRVRGGSPVGNVSADIPTAVWGPMDTAAFLAAMPAAFVGDIAQGRPVDPRYDEITERVSGFTTPGELAVLH